MKATFDHKQKINHNVYSFWFRPEKKLDFIPGQYADITIDSGKNLLTRTFTLSSPPSSDLISITSKFQQPSSDFKKKLQKLKPGDEVNIGPVMGDFVLPIDKLIESVFISGGIGITPLLSIVNELGRSGNNRKLNIIHAVKTNKDLINPGIFKDYNYVPILSGQDKSWPGHSGRLDINKVESIIPLTKEMFYFVSGPEPMVEDIVKQIKDRFNDAQIIMDYFPGYEDI